jgi:L-aminopeptidase/D-esterase-like protein
MNRTIQPFHTMYDGDVLYAVTTNETDDPALDDVALGAVAAEVAWDAVLSSVQTT